MDSPTTFALYGLGAAAAATSLVRLKARLALSRAKHPSLAGHARIARRLAAFVPYYEYDATRFFNSDDAPADVVARRRVGFGRLADLYRTRFARTAALTAEVKDAISDLQFTKTYRVPFQFTPFPREHLPPGAFGTPSPARRFPDPAGNRL